MTMSKNDSNSYSYHFVVPAFSMQKRFTQSFLSEFAETFLSFIYLESMKRISCQVFSFLIRIFLNTLAGF